ncbi:MAG: HlyD family efflux transporter periplasmic adaptor subunit [Planctomycetota bacterium]|nr:HlyD family efflux transporter periplasmic adaptor subunit [Planctomycetota bacterium]
MAKSKNKAAPFLILIALIAGSVYAAVHFDLTSKMFEAEDVEGVQGAPVRRGDLHISEVVRGNLMASDSIQLKVEIEGGTKITFLAEEGVALKKGDVVAEFDTSKFEEQLVVQEIAVNNSEAAVVKAEEQLDIQAIQNQSDLAAAELALELAELDLEKYTIDGGEWTNELAAAEESIVLKEEQLVRARQQLEWTKKLYDEGFVQRDQFEGDELAVQGKVIEVDQANRDLELKKTYGHRRRKAELESSVGTKSRNVDKVTKQARSRIADLEASRDSARYRLDRENKKLDRLRTQISMRQLLAPEPGLLVLARGRWGEVAKEGDDAWGGSKIGTIPKSDSLIVTAGIHETKVKKIRQGMRCNVTTDAFPGVSVPGTVQFVAIMASENNRRRGGNERSYKADIKLDSTPEGFRPGMSCNAEVLIEDLVDVLYIPRQCVLFDDGKTIVFVQGKPEIETREVEVGLDNNNWVEIKSGLTEGEIVLLAPPATFKPTVSNAISVPKNSTDAAPDARKGQGSGNKASGSPKSGSKGGPSSGSKSGSKSKSSRGGKSKKGGAPQ